LSQGSLKRPAKRDPDDPIGTNGEYLIARISSLILVLRVSPMVLFSDPYIHEALFSFVFFVPFVVKSLYPP
jgi:hypothetical protein